MLFEWVLLLVGVAALAGLVGSLGGVGGGIVLIPIAVVFLNIPLPEAIGASAMTVIATSSTTGAAYVRDRLTNVRIGMFLEIATVPGAFAGAGLTILAIRSGLTQVLLLALAVLLLATIPGTLLLRNEELPHAPDPDDRSRRLRLEGSYFDRRLGREVPYQAARTTPALGIAFGAGVVAGLFGIGGGVLKVLSLDRALHLPMKVSTATSNFMIGVTAAAGVFLLIGAGLVNPLLVAPLALGTVAGSFAGSRILPSLSNRFVRLWFVPVLLAFAIELILRGFGLP